MGKQAIPFSGDRPNLEKMFLTKCLRRYVTPATLLLSVNLSWFYLAKVTQSIKAPRLLVRSSRTVKQQQLTGKSGTGDILLLFRISHSGIF